MNVSIVKVALVYLGQAREASGTREEEFVLQAPATIEKAVSQALIAHPKLSDLMETIKFLINGQWATQNAELNDGDRVTLLPPVGGG